MDDLFKRVFERIARLSDEELREKLAGVSTHPIVGIYEASHRALGMLPTVSLDDAFFKQAIESYLLSQSISYAGLAQIDEWLAANDEQFLLAA